MTATITVSRWGSAQYKIVCDAFVDKKGRTYPAYAFDEAEAAARAMEYANRLSRDRSYAILAPASVLASIPHDRRKRMIA